MRISDWSSDVCSSDLVIVNDFHAMMVAVSTGVAMGMIAEPTAKALAEAGELELLLTDHAATTSGPFLYYPRRKQVMPTLRASIDYVRQYLPQDKNTPTLKGVSTAREQKHLLPPTKKRK